MFTTFRHRRDRFSFLTRTYCCGPSFARATPWRVLVPPLAVPQKSRCATSQPWRTSDTSPFALPRKAKPPKRTHACHSTPKKGTNPYE
jgi:hypothetical protein